MSKRYQVLEIFAAKAHPLARGVALEQILCARDMYCGRRRRVLTFALFYWGCVAESRPQRLEMPDITARELTEIWPAVSKKLWHLCKESQGAVPTLTERLARACEHSIHNRDWRILLLSSIFSTRSGPLDRTFRDIGENELVGTRGSCILPPEALSLDQVFSMLASGVALSTASAYG